MDLRRRPCIPALLTLVFLSASPETAWLQEQAAKPPEQVTSAQEPAKASLPNDQQPGELTVPAVTPAADETPAAGQSEAPADTGGTYTIKQADTLWDISNTFLKDPFLWPLIWKVNPYITNPDLIYPGNALVIPSLAPIERAIKEPEAVPPAAKQVAKVPSGREEPVLREEAPEMPFMGKRRVESDQQESVEEEGAQAGSRLILPEEIAPPMIDKYAMLSAGFVAREEGAKNVVVGGIEPKSLFGFNDTILVRMRSNDEVNIGDKMLIFEPYKRVRHPVTGKDYGKLTKVLGILQVTAIEPSGILSGRIVLSFDAIESGNMIDLYVEPSLVYSSAEIKEKTIDGYILEVRDTRSINGQLDFVYLDKGALDGVEPGDRFTVYLVPNKRGYPNKYIGEVQVFLVKERTSTAVVKKSTDAIAKGDRVTYKQQQPVY